MSDGGDKPDDREENSSDVPHSLAEALASLERYSATTPESGSVPPPASAPSLEPAPPSQVDGVLLTDMDGVILHANSRWAAMHGYDPEELPGRHATAFFGDEQPYLAVDDVVANTREAGAFSGTAIHVRKDGSTFEAWTEGAVTASGQAGASLLFVSRGRTSQPSQHPSVEPGTWSRSLGFAVMSTPDDHFIQVDSRVCEITGYTREELHQLTLTDITYSSDLASDEEAPSLFVAGELPIYTGERRLVRKDGMLRWVRLHKSVVVGIQEGVHLGLCVIEDLDGLQRGGPTSSVTTSCPPDLSRDVLYALPQGYALYEVIEDSRGEAVDCRILDINHAFERATRLEANDVVGKTILEVLPNKEAAWMLEICERVRRTGAPARFRSSDRGDGRSFEFSAFAPNDDQIALIVQDVTDLRKSVRLFERSQEELRTLCHRLNDRTEAERSSVASLLTDNIVKRLDALKAQLSLIRAYAEKGSGEALENQLDDGRRQLSELTQSVRALAARLRPPKLDDVGLLAALKAFGERFSKSTNVALIVDGHEPSTRLAPEQEIALFRVVEEALSNVAAHARATRAHVRLEGHEERVVLMITDDGVGIDPRVRSRGRLGLISMREIALGVGATLRVEPAPERGTTVIVELIRSGSS